MRSAWLVAAALVVGGPALADATVWDVRATPWPVELPCPRFDQLDFSSDLSGGYRVEWAPAAGAPQRFTLPRLREIPDEHNPAIRTVVGQRSFALDDRFPAGRLTKLRLEAQGDDRADRFKPKLACKGGGGEVEWQCARSSCAPEASYVLTGAPPRPRRLAAEHIDGEDALEECCPGKVPRALCRGSGGWERAVKRSSSARSVPSRKPQQLKAIGARTGRQVAEHGTSVRDREGAQGRSGRGWRAGGVDRPAPPATPPEPGAQ